MSREAGAIQSATTTEVICSYAPSQSEAVKKVFAVAGSASVAIPAIMTALGVKAVLHSSGSYIFTGHGGYIAGTLGRAVAAPLVLKASVVVAAAVIVLEVTCVPTNYPGAMEMVREYTAQFNRELAAVGDRMVELADGTRRRVRELNAEAIEVRDAVMQDVLNANQKVVKVRDETVANAQVLNQRAIGVRDDALASVRAANDKAIDVREAAAAKVRAANNRAIEIRDESEALLLARGQTLANQVTQGAQNVVGRMLK